ncbi:MAG TPA: DUF6049 family protein, partial [Acidimicrobiales bacterium]
AGLDAELTDMLRLGEDALSTAVPTAEPDRTIFVSGPLNEGGLQALRDLGVRQLVVPPEALAPVQGVDDVRLVSGVSELPVATSAAQPVDVAVADPALARLLEPSDDPVLSATHLLAELCAVLLDTGAGPGDKPGVVLLPRSDWQPDAAFLETFAGGLEDNRLLRMVGLDDWFRSTDPAATEGGEAVTRALGPATPQDLSGFARNLRLTHLANDTLTSILLPGNPIPDDVHALLTAGTTTALDDAGRGKYLDSANALLAPLRDAVETEQQGRLTIAGRSTEIPLTIRAKVDHPVRVRLRLASAKLTFPENDQIVEVDGSQQVRVPVDVRASGTFPLTVQLLSPEGDVPVGATTQLTVQATALGGLGILLSVGALLVLATWWVHHARTRHRQRRSAAAAHRHPAGTPAGVTPPDDDGSAARGEPVATTGGPEASQDPSP